MARSQVYYHQDPPSRFAGWVAGPPLVGGPSFVWAMWMKTNVYVDAFNLYYGCLKGTPYKWLDLSKLCQAELPANQVNRIRYFTARVNARPGDPQQPDRQQAYLRILRTLPNLSIHYGHYLSSTAWMPLLNPQPTGPTTVQVVKTEEKGSDVNLACHLLLDAFEQDCEAAVVVSNDSDLAEPIRLVRAKFQLKVVVLHPCRPPRSPSVVLRKVASKSLIIQQSSLAAGQFPPVHQDAVGTIHKPASW